MNTPQEISIRIKIVAKKQGMSMKKMLSELNLGINIVSQLANGQEMSYVNLAKIANYLDCSVDYLLGRTDNPNAHKDQSSNTVNGNYNAVDNSSVTVTTSPLNEHQKALLDIYNKLNPVRQAHLLVEADKMIEK